jgi:3-oxoacyl-[acyl-carrier protein] reductase
MAYPESLQNKVVLIVGGAGAIGGAAARMFASGGAKIVISYRGPEEAAAAQSVLAALDGGGHTAFEADVVDTDSLIALREKVAAEYSRLDILINAAGFTRPVPHADLDALDDELIDRMFQVNWRGQFAVIRTFAPLLKASGSGLIVSISSIAGTNGIGSSIAYCAVKAGIDVMTKSLAPQVRVLAVAPGVVDTSFVPGRGADFNDKTASTTPLKRIGKAQDIAAAILSCATHLTFSTGTTIFVDGGRSL